MTEKQTPDIDTAELEQQLARGQALLRAGSLQQARELGEGLLQQFAESTSAYEFVGDVLLASGESAKARAHFKRAMELEPANADAERKFASALLNLSQAEIDRQMAHVLASDGVVAPPRNPDRTRNATVAALLFPGLGQLYNRQYAKGLAIFGSAAIGLMLLFYGMVIVPWSRVTEQAGNQTLSFQEQMGLATTAFVMLPIWHKLLLLLGMLAFLAVYIYCILDAYKTATEAYKSGRARRS